MKKVLILGSTGSIGESTLNIIRQFPEKFKVTGLVAGKNSRKLKEQIDEFKPEAVATLDTSFKPVVKTYYQEEGILQLIKEIEFDIVVAAISGAAGIVPTYEAAKKAKRVALANKESLVCAGMFIKKVAKEIIPVDSEHSAVFQALLAGKKEEVKEIILTASGGPFRGKKKEDLQNITPENALNHPNWNMGSKVTIDSATLMNKGLEVIEAMWLFDIPVKKIKVVIHPQSIVHSMVRFKDNSFIAQMGKPDMRIPIAYALSYPERLNLNEELSMDYTQINLTFEKPDTETFKCLNLAYKSIEKGYPYPIILNAADEIAVDSFLKREIPFLSIPEIVEKTMEILNLQPPETIEDVIRIDKIARETAKKLVENHAN
ncbi:1-deoxy-D-xylulose-5-phosphate reductoisomerase [Desulfurobacterium atlanticum]|uniref:1-deoxy-D-xylulose 5-phosphate reductoisomerase n=1 Tax=Desulfurobacterium atlanticum TaxID=240169 RepID=A0A238Y6R6_9BACT|nr:1-deoxy-D-xylulose-5-phosphate reductoisomerase [Desulfurobacterium atlanticum]SNR66343.1 1-deoxy-D-xylulose 5-phosphate reductoisomerase [Desulfurobacterium atlanticum]